jgi:CheY-like chemotaxis protein
LAERVSEQVERPLRVLLAEDNPVNRVVAMRLLEKRGHSVAVAVNGREALEATEQRIFDVVLMDLEMPQMSGLEATAAIRKREHGTGTHLPIIAMTAHAMIGDRERCLAIGMDAYVSKPVRAEELFAALDNVTLKQSDDAIQTGTVEAALT